MGHSCSSGIAKFVARSVFYFEDNGEPLSTDLLYKKFIADPTNCPFCGGQVKGRIESYGGWTHVPWKKGPITPACIKGDSIIAEQWTLNKKSVWTVNEHEASHCGGYDISVVGNSEEAIKSFLKDHRLKAKIQKNIAIQNWG